MFQSGLIVFREVLEAALVISIVLAATKGIFRRGQWVAAGVLFGIIGALIVAGFAEAIANALEGLGQEVFNAGVLGLAVLMLAWHSVWMAKHGRELASQVSMVANGVSQGARPLTALLLVVSLAVLREGAEVVLFLYGIVAGGAAQADLFTGGVLGLVAGALFGVIFYRGLINIPTRHLFKVTNILMVLLAAGMAAQAAAFLNQAGYLPEIVSPLWDSSSWLPQSSVIGQLLHALIGYDDAPSGMQIVFYIGTIILVLMATKLLNHKKIPNTETV